VSDANADVAEADAESRPTQTVQVQGAVQVAAAAPEPAAAPPARSNAPAARSIFAAATASVPQAKPEPAPLTSGVIQSQAIAAIPGSSEPMKPVKVKTVQVKAGPLKLASAGPQQPATPITNAIPPARPEVPETSNAVVAKAETGKSEPNKSETNKSETNKPEASKPEASKPEASKPEANRVDANRVDVPRTEMPAQPANHGTGNGLLGVLPASSVPAAPASQAMAYADPAPRPQPQTIQQNGAIKPVAAHTGWIVQVGALESESEALLRIEAARNQARGLLAKADPFTEPVVAKGDRKLFRARFAGLDRDQAEAVCRTLKRSDISCITVRN
jgi:D-alanyl-D-alanine carboxypeptidase